MGLEHHESNKWQNLFWEIYSFKTMRGAEWAVLVVSMIDLTGLGNQEQKPIC